MLLVHGKKAWNQLRYLWKSSDITTAPSTMQAWRISNILLIKTGGGGGRRPATLCCYVEAFAEDGAYLVYIGCFLKGPVGHQGCDFMKLVVWYGHSHVDGVDRQT